jgi:broad specificity phosphatase PhoE
MQTPENLRIILARHPETEWQNVKDPESQRVGQRLLGSTDVSLSSIGHKRANCMGVMLKLEGITKVEASPLKRATTTAHIISSSISSIPVRTHEALREINFGLCEGLTFEELGEKFPETHRMYLAQGKDVSFPGGESFGSFQIRVETWLRNLLETNDNETILVVTHGGPTRVMICSLLGWPIETFWRIRQDYGGITVIGIYGERRIIERINNKVELPHEA